MQLLFESSEEGEGRGLGLLAGRVRTLRTRRRPHMGWNAVDGAGEPLVESSRLASAYFAHGFVCEPEDEGLVTAWTTHEDDRFASMIRCGNTLGVQFHPEKSSREGLALLRGALDAIRAARGSAR